MPVFESSVNDRLEPGALIAGLAFFASGASALVYQVTWQRILALHSGVGIHSIAMIVAAFMAGLGLGSYLGGLWSVRCSARRALLLFAVLELGIAAFGAGSAWFYYDLLYLRGGALYASAVQAGLLHFASLLPPTALMGMSLPFLVRALVHDSGRAGSTVGHLYGINVLGASFGALAAPWLLIRFLGVPGALHVAATGNALAGTGALLLFHKSGRSAPEGNKASVPPEQGLFPLWLGLYALSGFCALSLEIVWFRMVDVAVKATAFTFGTVLFVYLLGSAIGSLVGTRVVHRIFRPLRAFLACQCLLLLYTGLTTALVVWLPPETPGFRWLYGFWGRSSPLPASPLGPFLFVNLLTPALFFGPPTVLMGLSFPILQRAVHDDPRTSGRKVGFLQAANIAGCLVGSLLVGLGLLSWLGTAGTLRLLVAIGPVLALLGWRQYGGRLFAPLAVALALLVAFMPGEQALWLRLHASEGPALVEEDATGVVMLRPERQRPREWAFLVHGRRDSFFPYGGTHTVLGALPAIVHPSPRRIAIIGLGSGDTAWAAGCRSGTTAIRVWEIVAPQMRVLQRFDKSGKAPRELSSFLRDPRFDNRVADGRNSLQRESELWDVIEMDALLPTTGYSGNLYSEDFLSLCARRLAPGGVFCSWGPTRRIYATFGRAFPHVVEFGRGKVLLGSTSPIPIDVAAWRERLLGGGAAAYLGASRTDLVLRALESAKPGAPPDLLPNRDLFPRDEFDSPDASVK